MTGALINPGLVLLSAGGLVAIVPRAVRGPLMLLAALLALALPFASDFGAYAQFARLGVELTPLRLDPLSQVFGLAGGLAALCVVIASLARPDRLRDGAMLALFGGAIGAVYAGDLVSFTALLECASLATAALVFSGGGPQARHASITVLTWQSCGGAFLVVGAGLLWGQTGSSLMREVPITQFGPLLICLGLALKVGVFPAHAWLRAAGDHAPPLGLAAILGVGLLAPLYGLVRCFPGEPLLLGLGAVLTLHPLVLAATATTARQAMVFGAASLVGPALLAAGGGGEIGVAAGSGHAFALALAATLAPLCLDRPLPGAPGLPALLIGLMATLSLSGLPGGLGFPMLALLLDVLARHGAAWTWLLACVAAASAPLHLGGRWMALAWRAAPGDEAEAAADADFPYRLGAGMLAFLLLVNAFSPRWVFSLLPPKGVLYAPYTNGHFWAIGQLVLAGFTAWALLQAVNAYPKSRPERAVDLAAWRARFAASLSPDPRRPKALQQILLRLVLAWTKVFERFGAHAESCSRDTMRRNSHSSLFLLCFVAIATGVAWVVRSR